MTTNWTIDSIRSSARTNRAELFFNRRKEAPLPSGREAAVRKHVEDFRGSDEYQNVLALRQRLGDTDAEIATAGEHLQQMQDQLAISVVTGDSAAEERGLIATGEHLQQLHARRAALTEALSRVWREESLAYEAMVAAVSHEELSEAKPALADVLARIAETVGPLLDELHAARRDFDGVGKGWPAVESESVLGPEPIVDRPPAEPSRHVPITADGRLPCFQPRPTGPDDRQQSAAPRYAQPPQLVTRVQP